MSEDVMPPGGPGTDETPQAAPATDETPHADEPPDTDGPATDATAHAPAPDPALLALALVSLAPSPPDLDRAQPFVTADTAMHTLTSAPPGPIPPPRTRSLTSGPPGPIPPPRTRTLTSGPPGPIPPPATRTLAMLNPSESLDPATQEAAALDLPLNLPGGGPLAEVTPECPDRYVLRGERGRGGQARVLLAHDRHIGRLVAWKELLPGNDPGRSLASVGGAPAPAVARFLREARVTGQLEHPGIVPVYELGQREDGRLYYTMRLVRGRTLAAALEASADLGERLKLLNHFIDLCHAVAYAHSRGVIHRDIKPDNVMVGPFGETVLLDWGLARLNGHEEPEGAPSPRSALDGPAPGETSLQQPLVDRTGGAHTLDGATLGTPAYMSPEQAQGQLARIDERSDVWSLGAVLYEILTGKPPFTGSNPMAVAAKVCLERPAPVLSRCPKAPPELAAVVHKALSAAQDDRYATAGALADDINTYMTGGRVGAFNYSRRALVKRFARRHRAAFTAGGLALSAIIIALIFSVLAWQNESAARIEEVQARGREHTEQLRAHGHLAQALARRAETLAETRATLSSRVYAAASLVHNPAEPGSPHYDVDFAASAPELQPWRVRADSLLRQSAHRVVQGLAHRWQHDEVASGLAFSPDGRYLVSADDGGWLTLRNPVSGETIQRVRASAQPLAALDFSADGTRLATGGRDGVVRVWSPGDAVPRATLRVPGLPIGALALSPDGRSVAVAGEEDPVVQVWDIESRTLRHRLAAHGGRVVGLAWSPDGATIASGSWDERIQLHNASTGLPVRTLEGHTEAVYRVHFSPDGSQLVSAGYDHKVLLWSVATGARLRSLDGHRNAVHDAVFSADGLRIASGGFDGELRVWEARTGRVLSVIEGHRDTTRSLAFSPDGLWLASASIDRSVAMWSMRASDGLTRLDHGSWVYTLSLSADGTRAVTGGWDQRVRVYDVASGAVVRDVAAGGETTAAALSPDGTWLVAPAEDMRLGIWSVADGARRFSLPGHRGSLSAVSVSPDGTQVASAGRDDTVRLWTVPPAPAAGAPLAPDAPQHTLAAVRVLQTPGVRVLGLTYSVDGKRLATGSNDHKVRIYNTQTGALESTFSGHTDWVTGLSFAPDGQHIVTSGKDRQVILWNSATGQELRRFVGHGQWVNRARFSADGQYIATASDDRLTVVWRAATGEQVLRVLGDHGITDLRFTPDGKQLAIVDGGVATVRALNFDANETAVRAARERQREAEREAGMHLDGFELVADEKR